MRFSSFQKLFFITLLFVWFAAGLFWLDFFRVSQARIEILALPKEANLEAPNAALAYLSGTLRFYDRLLETHEEIRDPGAGLSPDDRKALWQKHLEAKTREGNGLSVTLQDTNQDDVRTLTAAYTETLIAEASRYYDTRTELDLRVVDGPLFATRIGNPLGYAATVLISGLALTGGFFGLLFFAGVLGGIRSGKELAAPRKLWKKKESQALPIGEAVPWIDPEKFVPVRPAALSYEAEAKNAPQEAGEPDLDGILSHVEEHLPQEERALSAPANLPVSDETPAFLFGEPSEKEQEETLPEEPEEEASFGLPDAQAPQVSRSEPSVEEYKRRLNELLRGGKM
jgi:hypothetical protein